MKKPNILAHRGYWKAPSEKNTFKALRLALERGYGIETDVRDLGNKLVISHDPPDSNDIIIFDDFVATVLETKSIGRIALNIKSDGLNEKIQRTLATVCDDISNFFAFDMSVPDTLLYKTNRFPFYTRVSEYEMEISSIPCASGVWVDNFSGSFNQIEYSQKILETGKRVAFVSPELHGRDHSLMWAQILKFQLHRHTNFELCTDYPDAAYKYFSEEK